MDIQSYGLEKVTPFKSGHVGIYVKFLGCAKNLIVSTPQNILHDKLEFCSQASQLVIQTRGPP